MLGFITCYNSLQLACGFEPPICSIKPDYFLCLNASCQGVPFSTPKTHMETLSCQCSLPRLLWGESEPLSPALLGLQEPSVIPLFIACSQVRCPWTHCLERGRGPRLGRAGLCDPLRKGSEFSGWHHWPDIPAPICLLEDGGDGARHLSSPITVHADGLLSPCFGPVPWGPSCAPSIPGGRSPALGQTLLPPLLP